jgi:hypothetical protein
MEEAHQPESTKGHTFMTMTSPGRVPMVMPADDIPGPGQGHWTYEAYAALPNDGHRYEIVDPWSRTIEVLTWEAGSYSSLGVFEGKAVLPSKIVPDFLVHVEQFFA